MYFHSFCCSVSQHYSGVIGTLLIIFKDKSCNPIFHSKQYTAELVAIICSVNSACPPSTHPSYSSSISRFTEHIRPDPLQMTPRLSIHKSISRSCTVRQPHCSLRWHRHGSISVMVAPVTLPVKPINRENLGTNRARRYDVISKVPRTNRAGRDIPWSPESVGEYKQEG